jgi:hypothetical protein
MKPIPSESRRRVENKQAKPLAPGVRIIEVCKWSMEVFAGRTNHHSAAMHGHELAILKLEGASNSGTPPAFQFWIYVFPDGTAEPPIHHLPQHNRVDMGITACQLPALLHLLDGATPVYAYFGTSDTGECFGNVHATYTRPKVLTTARKL